jgi:hypothetical protein
VSSAPQMLRTSVQAQVYGQPKAEKMLQDPPGSSHRDLGHLGGPCFAAVLPPPVLTSWGQYPKILGPGNRVGLICVAPLGGAEFGLWRLEGSVHKELQVPMSSTSPDRVFFDLDTEALGDGGPFICRYRLRGKDTVWSEDSEPTELVRSDGEPGGWRGTRVQAWVGEDRQAEAGPWDTQNSPPSCKWDNDFSP